jgi:monoamine oxidase
MATSRKKKATPPLPPVPPVYPHVPVNVQLKRIREANHGKKHVVILGSGMAGMVAAYELLSLGHRVDVIEASERAGGRVRTHHFGGPSYAELGAMRVPPSHDYTHHYITAMGLDPKLIPFINGTTKNFLDIRGTIARAGEAQAKIIPLFNVSSWVRTQPSGGAVFGKLMDALINMLTEAEQVAMFDGRADSILLQLISGQSLGDFLLSNGGREVRDLIGAFTSLEVWWDKAISMYLRDEIVGTGSDLQTLDGGMSQLPDAVFKKVEKHVRFGREVIAIRNRADEKKVTVVTRDARGGDGPEETTYDYVLCTIPFSVLRRTELTGFSVDKMAAITQMTYAASTKVALDCRDRFWEWKYGILGGASISDLVQRQTYYPMNDLPAQPVPQTLRASFSESGQRRPSIHTTTPQPAPAPPPKLARQGARRGALLGAYCWDSDARRLGALSDAGRADVVVRNVSRYHPELPDYVTGHASIDWEQDRWHGGAFVMLQPRELELYYHPAIRPEGRLFFAGEHCSVDQGWIQGALIASLRAVLEIVSV